MNDAPDTVDAKVRSIFCELVGERASRLEGSHFASETTARVAAAFSGDHPPQVAYDIGFHVADWNADAAFIVALHLFPEKFNDEEVRKGVTNLLIHAPNHLAAAATLTGYPIEDVFDVGATTASFVESQAETLVQKHMTAILANRFDLMQAENDISRAVALVDRRPEDAEAIFSRINEAALEGEQEAIKGGHPKTATRFKELRALCHRLQGARNSRTGHAGSL